MAIWWACWRNGDEAFAADACPFARTDAAASLGRIQCRNRENIHATTKPCPDCGNSNLMSHGGIPARGAYGPDLLTGAGGIFSTPKMRAVVCKDCGLVRYYVDSDALAKISTESGWYEI